MELLDLWAKSVRSWYNPFLGRKHASLQVKSPTVRDYLRLFEIAISISNRRDRDLEQSQTVGRSQSRRFWRSVFSYFMILMVCGCLWLCFLVVFARRIRKSVGGAVCVPC